MFEFEPGLMIWTAISFGLLVVLLYRSALPPLLDFLEEREKQIADNLAKAAAERQQAAELVEQQKAQLAAFREQTGRLLVQAEADGEKLKNEVLEKAAKQAELMIAQGRQELEQQKLKLSAEVKKETSSLVALATEKVLRRVVTVADHQRLIEESLREAGEANERN